MTPDAPEPAPDGDLAPWKGFKHLPDPEKRELAWLGDAVLGLWARAWLNARGRGTDQDAFARMTSNQFLSAFGQPDAVEAWIGKGFLEHGFNAIAEELEARLLPTYLRQEANGINLKRPSGSRRDKRR
ncbi:MAG: hypothetical protein ACFB21_13785 [Opitutales bacterium]